MSENPPTVEEDASWKLNDGRVVQYFKVSDWSFSNLKEEDYDYEAAMEAVEAWKVWAEFVKNNPQLGLSKPETVEADNEPATVERTVKQSIKLDTGEAYRKGYEQGYSDSEKVNKPPF